MARTDIPISSAGKPCRSRRHRSFERVAAAINGESIMLLDAYHSNASRHELVDRVAVMQRKIGDLLHHAKQIGG